MITLSTSPVLLDQTLPNEQELLRILQIYRCGLVFTYDTTASQRASGLASSSFQQPNQLLVCLSVLSLKGSMTAHRPVHFYLTVINHFNGFSSRKTIFPSSFPIISWTVKLHVNAPNGLTTCTPYYFAFSFH